MQIEATTFLSRVSITAKVAWPPNYVKARDSAQEMGPEEHIDMKEDQMNEACGTVPTGALRASPEDTTGSTNKQGDQPKQLKQIRDKTNN